MAKTAQPRTLALFTNRDKQRAVIANFLAYVQAGRIHKHKAVLSFYGVGGVGKTELCKKALVDFRARPKDSNTQFRIAEVDLDSDSVSHTIPIAQILGRVRSKLHEAGVPTPLFDYLYIVWWGEENPGQSIDLKHPAAPSAMAGVLDVADLLRSLAMLFGVALSLLPLVGVAQSVRKLLPQLSGWFEHTHVRRRFDGAPEAWSQHERIERMPVMLAHDLLDAVAHQPQTAVCLILDGFERVQSRESKPDAQWALATLIAEVLHCTETLPPPDGKPLRGHIGFMILGREQLRWAELYRRERVRTDWDGQIDHHRELQGLSERDARSFLLEKATPWERANGRPAVAELIARHVDEILTAASEQRPGHAPSYLPYYLDLAVLLIRENAEGFDPSILGTTPGELERRFLRSLEERHRKALQALALALEFDRKTFALLIARGFIGGYAPADFDGLMGDNWSFVHPLGARPGFHRFHRHMQDSLVASLAMGEDLGRAREIILVLLEQLYGMVKFDHPAEFGTAQATAYTDALNLLRTHEASGLLNAAEAVEWALRFDGRFDAAHAMALRRPHLDWTVDTARRVLGEEHLDTLNALHNLALTLARQGRLAEARALQERGLEACRRVVGEEHLDTLTAKANLAATLQAQGDLAGARALQERVLEGRRRVLGDRHSDTTVTAWNLGVTLRAMKEREAWERVRHAYLDWLMEQDPESLTVDQRTIRGDLRDLDRSE